MGRAPSYRSSDPDAARAYIERRWGNDIHLVDAMMRVYIPRLLRATLDEKLNERFDKIRELNETLGRAIVRGVSGTMKEIAALTAEINASVPDAAHDRIVPSGDELARLEHDVREFQAAFERVRAGVAAMAGGVALEGTAEDFRALADAVEAYQRKPNGTTRAALRRVTSTRPTIDNLRTIVVQKAEQTSSRLTSASEFDWAYYEIAVGLASPCDGDTFRTKRRDRWREVLRRARNRGGAAA